jgi:uncharacterized RDD family membrane protein YckC
MKTVEIKTTQNVRITYELAPARDRIVAFVLDSIFKTVATGLITLLLSLVIAMNGTKGLVIYVLLIFPIITFYSLIFEMLFHGQTPAKMLMKIRVIKLNGKQAQPQDYLIRWVFRLIDIYLTAGISGITMIISSPNAQRAGDLLSNTVVVKSESRMTISLREILRIDNRVNYQPQYIGIKNFKEEDIILIKNTLDRYSKYSNEAHEEAIRLLTQTLSERLGVPVPTGDRIGFLKTIVKDYIVLTR